MKKIEDNNTLVRRTACCAFCLFAWQGIKWQQRSCSLMLKPVQHLIGRSTYSSRE